MTEMLRALNEIVNDGERPAGPLILEKLLPRKVEETCDIFQQQFIATAERCERLADGLSEIANTLLSKASYCREQAETLPLAMSKAVREERRHDEFVSYYEPLIK